MTENTDFIFIMYVIENAIIQKTYVLQEARLKCVIHQRGIGVCLCTPFFPELKSLVRAVCIICQQFLTVC